MLEQKRTTAWNKIIDQLPELGLNRCRACPLGLYGERSPHHDSRYLNNLCDAFQTTFWPPKFAANDLNISNSLDAIRCLGSHKIEKTCVHHRKTQITAAQHRAFAETVSVGCHGLCLRCVKAGKRDFMSRCVEHQDVDWE